MQNCLQVHRDPVFLLWGACWRRAPQGAGPLSWLPRSRPPCAACCSARCVGRPAWTSERLLPVVRCFIMAHSVHVCQVYTRRSVQPPHELAALVSVVFRHSDNA